VSTVPPTAGAAYDIDATVTTSSGGERHLTGSLTVADVPRAKRLTLSIQPNDGSTVGVGQPVIVRFDQPVAKADRAGIERRATVLADHAVTGSWHWVTSSELHFRPKAYWPAHTHVQVRLDLNGVRASATRWGARDYTTSFTIGAKQVSTVDGAKHTMTVTVDGKTLATWPTSLGKPQFATRTGTYVVLEKDPTRRMTSCSVHITCTKGAPNFYDLTVLWDVRLTWSGTFVHAAPWSASNQGVANVSHGCINLTTSRGERFYNLSRPGDVVVVKNTGRTAADLVAKHDPGMADWNSSWATYVAGSALGHEVHTAPLPAR
jgi:lipoprotein-anchoring transpeptidase ErfK/SrfK